MAANFDNPGSKVISPTHLAHCVLRTNNFEAMRTFYKTFLGARPAFENDFLSFLAYDEEHHRIGIIAMPDIADKQKQSSGLEHIAFTFGNINDLALAYLQRKENGILPFWQINHGPTMSVYYKDPDGNILETLVDNFQTNEQISAYMLSEAYVTNPIGVDFDMEDVIGRLKSGESLESITKRPDSGPRGLDTVPQ